MHRAISKRLTPREVRPDNDPVLVHSVKESFGVSLEVFDAVRVVDSLFGWERVLVFDWESVFGDTSSVACESATALSLLRQNLQNWCLIGLQKARQCTQARSVFNVHPLKQRNVDANLP